MEPMHEPPTPPPDQPPGAPTPRPRYSRGERLYHTVQAATVMFLLLTGAWLLAGQPGPAARVLLSRYHVLVGLLGMAVMLTVAMFTRAAVWHNMHWAMSVESTDLKWWWFMLTLRPGRANRLPVGRFNPGQKAELLATPVTLVALLASGLLLWQRPSLLWVRDLHLGAAGLMVLLLIVHLYMTVVNRATRPSLPIMWAGRHDPAWEAHHYPRAWARPRTILAASVLWVVTAVLGSLVFAGGGGETIRRQVQGVVMPGKLSDRHAWLEADCAACHNDQYGVVNERCTGCHTGPDGAAAAWPAGRFKSHHLDAGLDCLDCHTEHKGRSGVTTVVDTRDWAAIDCRVCHRDSDAIAASFNGRYRAAHRSHRLAGVACASCHTTHFDRPNRVSRLRVTQADCSHCHHVEQTTPAVQALWRAESPAVTPASGSRAFEPRPQPPALDASCLRCHATEAAMFAGRYEPLKLTVRADPMSGQVRCAQCHRYDAAADRWTAPTDLCATCHKATEADPAGGLRFIYRELGRDRAQHVTRSANDLAARLDLQTPPPAGQPAPADLLRDLRHGGAHNIELADQLIDYLNRRAPRD